MTATTICINHRRLLIVDYDDGERVIVSPDSLSGTLAGRHRVASLPETCPACGSMLLPTPLEGACYEQVA